jgi:hypothetical protein
MPTISPERRSIADLAKLGGLFIWMKLHRYWFALKRKLKERGPTEPRRPPEDDTQ